MVKFSGGTEEHRENSHDSRCLWQDSNCDPDKMQMRGAKQHTPTFGPLG